MEFTSAVRRIAPRMKPYLPILKGSYTSEISERTQSRINSFEELVNVFIKRDIVDPSEGRWPCLDEICGRYLGQTFEQAAEFHKSRPTQDASPLANASTKTNIPAVHSDLPQLHPRVTEYIADRIGNYQWRSLARALSVKERDIEIVERTYANDAASCVREVLKIYVRRIPNPTHEEVNVTLLRGLSNIRRQDLVENVSLILRSTSGTSYYA